MSFWPYSDFPLLTHNGHNQGDSDHDFYPSPIAVMTASPGKSKMAARGSKKNFGSSSQLSLNKFFDLRIPSMRKVDDGGGKNEKNKTKNNIMLFILATHIVASRPPKCRSKIQNTRLGLQCQTPLRSYPLSLIPCSLSPSTVPFTKFR